MSLQVWLPLTKDLRQQGISSVIATNSGTTYSSTGGKLGGCYTIAPTSGITLPASAMTSFTTECSVAFWIKINSWKSSYDTYFQAGLNSTPWAHYRFGILRYNTGSNLCFTITNSSGSSSSASYITSNLETGVWYHLVFTYTAGKVKCYRNGVLDKEYTTTIVPDFAGITNISIGRGTNGSSYPTDCNMNDFRIYDHCLSSMEVKEISKGLVLHYSLNDKYCESVTNLASTATGGWNNSGNCTRLFNDTSLDSSKPTPGPVISIKITTAGNCALTCGTTSASHPLKTLTFSVWCYLSGPQEGNVIYIRSTKTDGNVGSFEYNGSADPRNWPLNKWIRLEKTITTASDATTFYFCTYANILNRYVALNGWQIEEKSHASPWTPPGTTRAANVIEYDCSGLCNNGIKNNLPTYSSDTAKYNVSTYLDGVNQTIQLPNLSTLIQDGIFTFSVWFKKETDKWSSKGWETIFGGPSGFEFQSKSGSTNSPLLYAYSWGKGTKVYTLDEWHHFVMVRTTEGTTFYLDGEQAFTGTAGSIPSGNYFLGSWSTTSSQNYKGFMGDARIYATAFSADDVLALYNKKI